MIIAVANGNEESNLFSGEERAIMFNESTAKYKNVSVQTFDGLTIDIARKYKVDVLIRGLRAVTDFTTEFDMALMNRDMERKIESIFFITSLENLFLSASRVRELASYGVSVDQYVPKAVAKMLNQKFN